MTEAEAMVHALELARRGWGRVEPNPLVGAVLLDNGRIVGEGYHAEFGGAHAEVMALESCARPRGSTCVVTLEPCAHAGKTPPCAEALIEAGVQRVVAAVADPHPDAQGGIARLRRAGVDVSLGVLADRAAALNAPFLWNAVHADRPFVAVKLATSLDGLLSDSGDSSQWISGAIAREYVQWLRAGFAAVGVGGRTARVDDPMLTVRGPTMPRVPPTRIVFSRSGDLPARLRVIATAHDTPTIVVLVGQPPVPSAPTNVEVVRAETVRGALGALRRRGLGSILVEGGGHLTAALLREDVVDRLYWIQAPIWLGRGTAAFPPRAPAALASVHRWTVTDRLALGDDTLLVVDRQLCLQESLQHGVTSGPSKATGTTDSG